MSSTLLLPCVHAQGLFVHLSSLSTNSLRFSSARVWWMVQNSIHALGLKLWLIEGLSYVCMGKPCICHVFCPHAMWWAGPCTHKHLTTFTWRAQNRSIGCLRVRDKVKKMNIIVHAKIPWPCPLLGDHALPRPLNISPKFDSILSLCLFHTLICANELDSGTVLQNQSVWAVLGQW